MKIMFSFLELAYKTLFSKKKYAYLPVKIQKENY